MKNRSKTKIIYINSVVALLSYILQIIINFLVRKIFINQLGVSFLGYNSVFSNLLQMLNLVELGIGVAITSFLYKPIVEHNQTRIEALMFLYKKIYRFLGGFVFILGVLVSFFLNILIPDSTISVWYLRLIFYINLIGSVSTYFLAYKRTLIIANQKSYITNFVDAIMHIIFSGFQMFFLIYKPSYIIFLIINIIKNIIANIFLSVLSDQWYGKIKKEINWELIKEYKIRIKNYVKDIFVSRIGAVVFYGTDNVIISLTLGSLLAGYLSNYTMVTNCISGIVSQILNSLQATYGSYINSEKKTELQNKMTYNYMCSNFMIANFCMICFINLIQPFVNLCFGENLLLPFSTAVWLGINLLLTIMIQLPSQVFIVYNLFRYDRPIIITSAIINILVSVIFVKQIGFDGVLIGTFIASLIYLFSRFFIISKYVYQTSYLAYLRKIILYFFISIITTFISYYFCKNIDGNTYGNLIIKIVLVLGMATFVPLSLLSFTSEYKYIIDKMIPEKIVVIFKPALICFLAFIWIFFAYLKFR